MARRGAILPLVAGRRPEQLALLYVPLMPCDATFRHKTSACLGNCASPSLARARRLHREGTLLLARDGHMTSPMTSHMR